MVNIASQDFQDGTYTKLAKEVNKQVTREDIAGVMIMHGSDTIEESAFFLDLTVNTVKPVVLVGANRPSTSDFSDGKIANLSFSLELGGFIGSGGYEGCRVENW